MTRRLAGRNIRTGLIVAAICMLIATRTFAHDRAAARTRGSGPRAGSAALELL